MGEVPMLNIESLKSKFSIKDFAEWKDVNADLIITDPPFGIRFNGKPSNYNRDEGKVVEGYIEWDIHCYKEKMNDLLDCIAKNLSSKGQAIIFSGWNNSNTIHNAIESYDSLKLEGKLYWSYNFAPYCKLRPSHNVYELYWIIRDKGKKSEWYYNRECSTTHCNNGESNLSTLVFKRDYKVGMPKYPTRLPFKLLQCLIEHFSQEGDLLFDPLCGSGMVGLVAHYLKRDFVIGDLNKEAFKVFNALLNHYSNDFTY